MQTYNVKINKSELDGGQIKAWGSDNNKVDVTEYDGNNQYVKEVKEGEEFNFQITLNDGFEIAQVKVNGNAFDPANTEGNVITYKVAGINEEKVIDVTYNKIETPAEEKAAEEPKTEDETKVEEPAVAEPEDNSISTASLNENISTVADSEKTIKVGETASLKSSDYKSRKYSHIWSITSGNDVIKLTGSGYKVTAEGLKEGTATVSDWIYRYSLYHTTITYTVRVTSSEKVTVKPAIVYYLKDPTKDANSNDTGHWGDAYGNATVNVEGAKWVNDKNCFNGLSQRVVSWPNNTNVIPKNSTHWNAIFNEYKASIQTQLGGVKITADDVEEITLVPAKISKNNGTDPDLHLDCNVNIKCKSVALVKYYLFDANGTNWEMLGSKNYIVKDTSTTKPGDVTSRTFPETKTVNGVTYKFSGWYTDENLTQRAPEFPAKVTGSVNYYAKYTAEYKVSYNLAGGKFSDDSTSVEEKHNADTTVTVKEEPTRAGYEFIGWTVEGLGTTTTLDSGETFTMPNRDVTLTAKWEEQKIEEFLTLVPKDVSKPYDGTELQAGTAKVTGKVEGADTASVKIEYSLNGKDWTTNPSEVTATNVSDSKTVQVRATSEKYTGELTGIEELTITPKPVTVTANSYNKAYGATDPEFTATVEGTLGSDTVNYKLNRETGEDVGTYKILAIGDAAQGNYSVTYYPGTLTITAATRPEDRQLGVTSYEGVYDANDHTITVDNVLDGDVVEYSYDGGETWTTNLNQYKDVTETTIKVRVTNANYDPNPVELEGTVKITPKPVTVTANSDSKTYGAVDPEFTATVVGTLGTDKVTYSLSREAGEDVGEYLITASGDVAQGNYSVRYNPGTLTIVASDREKAVEVASYNGVYDAKKHTIEVKNLERGDLVKYSYDNGTTWEDELKEYTDVTAGTTILVQVMNDNYAEVPKLTGTVTITPKPVTVTANSDSKTYGAADPEFTVTVVGTLGTDKVTYNLSREAGEDVGTYPITASGDAIQGNYNVTYHPGTLTITAATRPEDRQLGVTSYEGVYDANDHTITVDNVLDGDVVEYSYDGGETWTTNLNQYKDVTETTIKVRVTNANYDPNPVELEGTVKITPATLTVSTPIATKVYEGTPLTAAGTISGFVNGETATFTTTGSQTEVGSTANTYSLTWDGTAKESNYTVAETIGTLTVTAQSIDPENPDYKGITVDAPTDVEYTGEDQTWLPTVTDGNGKALVKDTDYTVTYDNEDRTNVTGIITVTINGAGNYVGTITRTYQITPKPVTITTESKTRAFDGTALTAGGKVEGIVSGETYGFKTTGSQTYVGSSQNTYEMVWADSEVEGTSGTYTAKKTNYTVTESIGTLVVTAGTPENPLDPTLVVNKTHDKSQTYKAGDVITFTITAKNIYEEAKTITLEELEGVALDANVFENVAPGAEVTATATYTVTEQDIVNGTFTNNVTVTFSGVDDKFTGTDTVDELEDANPHMTITKTTVGAEEGHIYKLNDVINYKITATNDGNLTLTNVKVEDALTGNVGENAFTIDILAPGEAQTFDVRYVVTENDVLEGKVINNATGTATDPTDPDEPKTPVTPGEKEDPIETPNPSLAVVKTSDKTGVVKLGETITYTITVTNNGNVTINDIEVTDELTGNTGDNAFTIDRLAVGETKQFTATYTVTEDDILEGTIVNRATATGKDPRNEEVTGDGEVRVDTEEKDSHLTVSKETTSEPENGEKYALGETINYLITVTNDGNLTLTNVKVTDELTGDEWTIDELAPGEEETFDASYTVKESDLGKTVVNVATATGTTPDPDIEKPDVTPGETEDPVEEEKPALAIDKKVVDPKEEYQIGEVVTYEITVTNIGNVTQKNILVEDQMKAAEQARITNIDGANGISNGKQATLDKLVPGAKATITVEYTIVYDDRGNTITNAAVADGEGENPVTPDVPVVIEKVYNINVVHEFAPNNEGDVALLPEDYTIENLKPNTEKSITAEAVKGYVAYPSVQNVTVVDKDITVTFQYYKDVIGTDPTDPEKPDGVSDEFQVVVRFAAVNGTVSTDRAVVTLVDKNGKPAKDGVGHLTKNQIAAATANTGYDQSSLSWTPGEPTITYDIIGEMTFTATFTATPAPAPAPTEPTTPPARPTRPTTRTTASTGNATVENAVTPSEEKVEEKAAEIKEVLKSDDDKVPVANQKLDDLYSGDAKKDNPVI